MQKDFDVWNEIKKNLNGKMRVPFCYSREIWWCSLGVNVGSEEDGKNNMFERPVLIIKVINKDMIRIVPLTSKIKADPQHVPIKYEGRIGTLRLSHLKTISTKRLSRKLCTLDEIQFSKVITAIINDLI